MPDADVLSYSRRIRAESQHARAASSATRVESQSLHAAVARLTALSMQLWTRAPYARVTDSCMGKTVHVLVRRDGTVYGEPTGGGDPLMATLAAVRGCDHVSSVSFHHIGWRPGVPFVQAGAHFDELQQEARIRAVRGKIAEGLNERVIRRIFEAGLAATSARTRTTNPQTERQLGFIVEALDGAVAELRAAIFTLASGDPDDETPPAAS